ncbi:phosphatidylserine decarboxylase-domain-containing protein [Mycena capillaripes]|nr:phosphatidylserine decarboxylase-domain-containing protein [Mycena capillaripes]
MASTTQYSGSDLKPSTRPGRLFTGTRTSFDIDPLVVISFGKNFRTRVIRHSLNPVWDEKLLFHVSRMRSGMSLSSNDYIGEAAFNVADVPQPAAPPPMSDVTAVAASPSLPTFGEGGAMLGGSQKEADAAARERRTRIPLYAEAEGDDHPMKELKLKLEMGAGGAWSGRYQPRKCFWRQYLKQYDMENTSRSPACSTRWGRRAWSLVLHAPQEGHTERRPHHRGGASVPQDGAPAPAERARRVDEDCGAGIGALASRRACDTQRRSTYQQRQEDALPAAALPQDAVLRDDSIADCVSAPHRQQPRQLGVVRACRQREELPAVSPPAAQLRGGGRHHHANRSVREPGLEHRRPDRVGNFVTASQAQRKWCTRILGKISSEDYRLGADATRLRIKGSEFTVARLLGDAYRHEAERYLSGALAIFRLAPQDYHRFHSPVDGVMGNIDVHRAGKYYTVNPRAIRTALDVYGENARKIVPIDSPQFGRVTAFGSTVVLLFEKDVVEWDEDLVVNDRTSLETLVREWGWELRLNTHAHTKTCAMLACTALNIPACHVDQTRYLSSLDGRDAFRSNNYL